MACLTEGATLSDMPTLTVRFSDEQLLELKDLAAAQGLSLGGLVKRVLFGEPASRLEDLERRLARLEELAGL
jgi:hypothetical protein